MAIHGIGSDVVSVRRFARMFQRGGPSFARHWFSDDELSLSLAVADPAGALAQRFAVKEAVLKALGMEWHNDAAKWREIEIGSIQGAVEVRLHGECRDHALRMGVQTIHASVARVADLASALAVSSA